jgi:hypothetical protein
MSEQQVAAEAGAGASPPPGLAPAVSPLTEASAGSLNEFISSRVDDIFNTDPRERDAAGNYVLTDSKLRLICEYYRKERQRFLSESQAKEAAGGAGRKKKPTPKSVAEALADNSDDTF